MLPKMILIALAAYANAQGALVTYNCDDAKAMCAQDVADGKTAQSICDQKFSDCQACATEEHSCRAGSSPTASQDGCTIDAQICYERAESPGSTLGYYGCTQASNTCNGAPNANHSFCGAQHSACEECQEEEQKCRDAPGANQSLCSSQAGGCFDRAMKLSS